MLIWCLISFSLVQAQPIQSQDEEQKTVVNVSNEAYLRAELEQSNSWSGMWTALFMLVALVLLLVLLSCCTYSVPLRHLHRSKLSKKKKQAILLKLSSDQKNSTYGHAETAAKTVANNIIHQKKSPEGKSGVGFSAMRPTSWSSFSKTFSNPGKNESTSNSTNLKEN